MDRDTRNAVARAMGAVVPLHMSDLARRPPLYPIRRAMLFVVAFIILHGFCMFVVSQVARLNPGLIDDNPTVASLLCGDGASMVTRFDREAGQRRRSLDAWLECRNASGSMIPGGQAAAWLSGLGLSLPLGMLLFGWVFRKAQPPSVTRVMKTLPARRRDRWVFTAAILLAASIIGVAGAGALLHYQADAIGRSAVAGHVLCGPNAKAVVIDRYSRHRRLECTTSDGRTDDRGSGRRLLVFALPFILILAVPGVALVWRIRRISRPV